MNIEFWRKRKGLSQSELAHLMNTIWKEAHQTDSNHYSTDMISRIERKPNSTTFEDLKVIQKALGVTLDQLSDTKYIPPQLPEIKSNWNKVKRIQKWGLSTARECPDKELSLKLNSIVKAATRKPKIAFLGRPDAGKTTMINILLGEKDGQWLPTGWTPETNTVCLIKHINDRPSWTGNDKVLIFHCKNDEMFDFDNILDDTESEKYCKENMIAAGGFELLKDYASHKGNRSETEEVSAIIIFSGAPILENCDLIDLPGFNPEGVSETVKEVFDSRDSMLSIKTSRLADAVVYMSIANSFCYSEDAEMVKLLATSLPALENKDERKNHIKPFGNLFVVASQAMAVPEKDHKTILDEAAKRLWSRIKEHASVTERQTASGYNCNLEAFRKSFFISESMSGELSEQFLKSFVAFTQELPVVQAERAKNELLKFFEEYRFFLNSKLKEYICSRDKKENAIERLQEDENKNVNQQINEQSDRVLRRIDRLKKDSLNSLEHIYNNVINASNIKKIIEDKNYKKNQRDLSELSNDLNAKLNNKISQMLYEKSNLLSNDIEQYILKLDHDFSGPDLESISVKFNVKRAFVGGFAGAASFGALAAWAATLGNLGGYIIVAKAVSVLAALGIHLGGTAAVISAVSSIGGPVTLGIGIAVMVVLSVVLSLGGTWKKTIGGKIVKQYEKSGALDALKDEVEKFWDETVDTFKKGRDNIIKEWNMSLKERRNLLEDGQTGELEKLIVSTQASLSYFERVAAQLESISIDEDTQD